MNNMGIPIVNFIKDGKKFASLCTNCTPTIGEEIQLNSGWHTVEDIIKHFEVAGLGA